MRDQRVLECRQYCPQSVTAGLRRTNRQATACRLILPVDAVPAILKRPGEIADVLEIAQGENVIGADPSLDPWMIRPREKLIAFVDDDIVVQTIQQRASGRPVADTVNEKAGHASKSR